jgi:hypothetical protein
LTLISCYHRPQDRLRENDITNILDTGASVIAAGDCNSKHLTWGSRETNRNGRILFDLADATDFLIEAPPEPTYYDSRGYRADILDIALIKNVPFQIRLHVSLALNSDHMPVLMHIGDEANDANTNITIRNTNWPRFAEILETDFGPIPRTESVEDLESAAGALEDKIKSAMTDSTRIRVEPRQKEILPQWIVDLIRASHFHPKAREELQTSPKLPSHQSSFKHRKGTEINNKNEYYELKKLLMSVNNMYRVIKKDCLSW